ncbi:MAG: PAS domain S-box protein [Bacteroidota bacterium]|nr:PAS domain S-box protein [Bacteroidota bacterium]
MSKRIVISRGEKEAIYEAGQGEQNQSPLEEIECALTNIMERLHLMTRATNDAVYDYDILNGSIEWGEGYNLLFGYSTSKNTISDWGARIHPDDSLRIEKSLSAALKLRQQNWSEEYQYKCADDSYKYVHDRGYMLYGEEQKPVRMIGAMQDITDRRHREEQLRMQTALFRQLYDGSPSGILLFDKEDCVADTNPAFEKIFGYTLAEIKGRGIHEFLIPAVLEDEGRIIAQACLAGNSVQKETKRLKKDGTHIDVLLVAYPLVVSGKVEGIYRIYTDISDRKREQERLRESEQNYRMLVNNINEGVMHVDNNDIVLYVNDRLCEMTGYSKEELLGNSSHPLLVPEEDWEFLQKKNAERRSKIYDRYEINLRTRHGKRLWASVSAAPVLDTAGIVIGSMGYITDITERKKSEMERERLASILEASVDLVSLATPDCNVLYINPSGRKLLGLTDDKYQAHASAFYPPKAYAHLSRVGLPTALKNGYWRGETVIRTGKREVPVSQIIIAHKNEAGAVEYISSIVRDISEHKESENLLRKKNQELETINSELDRFVYSASHQMRAPLTSVLGLINLAEADTPDTSMHNYLEMMRQSIDKLDGFLKDIIHHTHYSRMAISPEPILFPKLTDEVLSRLMHMDGFKDIDVRLDLAAEVFYSDRICVRNILTNLISNAIKYRKPGQTDSSISVKISVEETKAVITINDNGTGIDERLHSKIYDMFFRGANTSAGSGLGLYIVKEIVHKLDGFIEMKSAINEGTEFRITLPNKPPGGGV